MKIAQTDLNSLQNWRMVCKCSIK